VVVGDSEGYLHFLAQEDGSFAARQRAGSSGVVAAPVANDARLFALTRNGRIFAYSQR
jgi:outer membrane protein assembly factor BamB